MSINFSSVFNTEYISSLPVPVTKFECDKTNNLGQLVVTPEMIAKTVKKMKDNKSPGVDGIPPTLLNEIVEQISTPLAEVYKLNVPAYVSIKQYFPFTNTIHIEMFNKFIIMITLHNY